MLLSVDCNQWHSYKGMNKMHSFFVNCNQNVCEPPFSDLYELKNEAIIYMLESCLKTIY